MAVIPFQSIPSPGRLSSPLASQAGHSLPTQAQHAIGRPAKQHEWLNNVNGIWWEWLNTVNKLSNTNS
ncbi:uncharacterized protein N7529_009259 [Penicillium soppii]|uniref:uncharacterized protein n=1 Tax=Penicillium soppii TaxID=69789 RepID=UPI00254919BB|nr:uncharacterized protein N7529_009259 [Penicillium soppii]KAJ5855315.1 hypothetical protein N7529_009259 [Penicillium soppii]